MDHGERQHADLSPSSSDRWITCPGSVRLIAAMDRVEDSGSPWAAEGTRAHELAEVRAAEYFGLWPAEEVQAHLARWRLRQEAHPDDDVDEMERHATSYVSLLADIQADLPRGATLHLEMRLHTGVPGCWGTGDATFVSPEVIRVVDYKYGQGVAVVAQGNSQLRLYGLGALETFDGVLGDAETIGMTIHQPRVGSTTHEFMTAADLRRWRDDVALPAARETSHPDARIVPSDKGCRFCPVAGACAVRARHVLVRDFGTPDLLDPEGLADAWRSLESIRAWCNAVEAEALRQTYREGVTLPGLKVVMSGGRRGIPDPAAAIKALQRAGFPKEKILRPSVEALRTLKDLERVVGGPDALARALGDLLVRSPGSPAITDEGDSREAVTSLGEARKDFETPVSE